jgi:integrase/recombinase XerD
MPTRTAARPQGQPLKSPLAAPGAYLNVQTNPLGRTDRADLPSRRRQISDLAEHLRSITNRWGRPFEENTISTYTYPAKALDAWMTEKGIDGDFTTVDTAMLNRYFRDYYQRHGQGGTNAQQRNLLPLFKFLQEEHGHPHPYTSKLNRYTEIRGRPKTLSGDFVSDLLDVTGSGKARDFETARDHALIRILRNEGVRRGEVLSMVMHGLPADIIRQPVFRLVPLKGARNEGEGRLVLLSPASASALAIYLRARRNHKLADSEWVWLGTRNRGRFVNTGIRKMLVRRAAEAGYQDVTPHQFRHTFSDGWLKAGGSEGDLMRLNGWKTRSMVDRYADDVADQRALEAKRRMGDQL